MIRHNEVFKIGYIAKHRGLRGEVEMSFTDDCFDRGTAPYLVLDMDGILVPFFWEEYRFKNDDTVIIKFEDIDNEAHARQLVGHAVYYPKSHISQTDTDTSLSSYKALTGYTVYDHANQMIGTITHVDDSSANTAYHHHPRRKGLVNTISRRFPYKLRLAPTCPTIAHSPRTAVT